MGIFSSKIELNKKIKEQEDKITQLEAEKDSHVKEIAAENARTNTNIFQTEADGDYLLINQYNGFGDKKIIMPSRINGKPVIGIWNGVFENCAEFSRRSL